MIDLGPNPLGGIEFTVGATFLERYYTIYNNDESTVGFASTQYTDATDIN